MIFPSARYYIALRSSTRPIIDKQLGLLLWARWWCQLQWASWYLGGGKKETATPQFLAYQKIFFLSKIISKSSKFETENPNGGGNLGTKLKSW